MKIKNILALILFLVTFSFYAQNDKLDEKREKVKAFKVSFLTTELELTSTEAEKFWPIYNQYEKENRELLKQRREMAQSKSDMSPENRLNEQFEFEERMLEIRKKYTKEFGKAVPSDKVLRLFEAERAFKANLVKELQQRRQRN